MQITSTSFMALASWTSSRRRRRLVEALTAPGYCALRRVHVRHVDHDHPERAALVVRIVPAPSAASWKRRRRR
jgi:hypothetical protein